MFGCSGIESWIDLDFGGSEGDANSGSMIKVFDCSELDCAWKDLSRDVIAGDEKLGRDEFGNEWIWLSKTKSVLDVSCMYLGKTGLFEMLGIGIGELRIPLDVGLVRQSM